MEGLDKNEVHKTLEVLLGTRKNDTNKVLFADEEDDIYMQFGLKRIPQIKNKIVKLRLPHSVRRPEQEVCLFVKDLDRKTRDHEITERHFKDILASKGINCIAQVIPLKALKLEYKPFEAKRNLSNMFDLFIADERIVRLLPAVLGKHFYGRKKHPIQVNVLAKDLKKEIERVVNDSRCIISGKGASSSAVVGHTGMSLEDLTDNVMKAVDSIGAAIPGGPVNIQNVYVRTTNSMSLPLYVSFGSKMEVMFGPRKPKPESVTGEISTLMHGQVQVSPWGEVHVIRERNAKRETEDGNILEESDDEIEFESDGESDKETKGKYSGSKIGKKIQKAKTDSNEMLKEETEEVEERETRKQDAAKRGTKTHMVSKTVGKTVGKTQKQKGNDRTKKPTSGGKKILKQTQKKKEVEELDGIISKQGKQISETLETDVMAEKSVKTKKTLKRKSLSSLDKDSDEKTENILSKKPKVKGKQVQKKAQKKGR